MSSEERNHQFSYLFHSPLLLFALNFDSRDVSIASSAVSDAFSMVRRISNRIRSISNSTASIISPPVSRTGLQLPSWVEHQSHNERQHTTAGATVHGPMYLFCDDTIIISDFITESLLSVIYTARSSINCTTWPIALEKYPGP